MIVLNSSNGSVVACATWSNISTPCASITYWVSSASGRFLSMQFQLCWAISRRFNNGENLLFYPTKEEATQLWEKDNKWDKNEFVIKYKEDSIMEMVEDGTYRFPSIIEVVKAAKKKFPDSLLCFSLEHSRNEFATWLAKCYGNEKTKECAIEILNIIGVK